MKIGTIASLCLPDCRRFVVDQVIGSVVVYCTFGAGGPNGGSGAPR